MCQPTDGGGKQRVACVTLCAFLLVLLVRDGKAQMQIIGIQEDECELSPNLYQQRPTFIVCMAENAPFLVKRELYSPGGDVGCPDNTLQQATESALLYKERYDEIEQVSWLAHALGFWNAVCHGADSGPSARCTDQVPALPAGLQFASLQSKHRPHFCPQCSYAENGRQPSDWGGTKRRGVPRIIQRIRL